MHVTRRTFLGWTVAAGPVAMTLWMGTGRALGRDTPDCALPTPAEAQGFVPDEMTALAGASKIVIHR